MGKFAQRSTAAALAIAAGPVLFAGTALAGGWGGGTYGSGGNGGNGGSANANCGVPIGVSLGIIGQGGNVSQCNATGGRGGNGGDGVRY